MARGEEVATQRQRQRTGGQRIGTSWEGKIGNGMGFGGRPRQYVLVHISQPFEICWKENIECSWLDEQLGTRDSLITESCLDDRCIFAGYGVREGREVGKEKSVSREVRSEGL